MKVVIVGGVAGGATAAARLRRLDEEAEIVILERSGYVSYANCGLPYYIGGTIRDKEALTLQTPESFQARFRIDVRVRNEALSIQPEEHTVTVRRLEDGSEYRGYRFGARTDRLCEVVFNTSMVGYQEIVSDPSYTDQAVIMTYPLIGNYGMAADDYETPVPTIEAMIVRD